MAGKAKSVYLTVSDLKTHKTIMTRTFFNAADLKKFVESEEFKNLYPSDKYYWVKETY